MKSCDEPEKSTTCIVYGTIILALSVVSMMMAFQWTQIIGIVLPILYFIGAMMNKNAQGGERNTGKKAPDIVPVPFIVTENPSDCTWDDDSAPAQVRTPAKEYRYTETKTLDSVSVEGTTSPVPV